MKILCVSKNAVELAEMKKTLTPLGHEVVVANGVKEGHEKLAEAAFHCLVLDGELPFSEACNLVKMVRSLTSEKYIFVLWQSTSENQLAPAYHAGIDCDVPKKAPFAVLKAKLLAADRLSALKGGEPWVSPDAASSINPEAEAIRRAPAWAAFASELEGAASTFLNSPVTVAKSPCDCSLEWVSGIVLANAEKQVEIRFLIGTDKVSAGAFATQVFGEDSAEMQADLVGEMANLSMGVFKSGFGKVGLAFAGSLPQMMAPEKYEEFLAPCQFQESFTLTGPKARIRVHLGVLAKRNEWVPVINLKEGMVIANDVHNERGLLLMKGGTRLSSAAVAQLRSVLNVKQTVEVAIGGR